MKKSISLLLLIAMMAALLCVPAMAGEEPTIAPTVDGAYAVNSVTFGFTITPQDASQSEITGVPATINAASETFYPGAVRFSLTYPTDKVGSFYLVLVLNKEITYAADINAGTINYIDQQTATASGVSFNLYTSELKNGTTYHVYIASNDGTYSGLTEVASFKYYQAYKLGDVNNDTKVDTRDAVLILRMVVKDLTSEDVFVEPAANTNGDDRIDTRDAVLILRLVVKDVDENFHEIT